MVKTTLEEVKILVIGKASPLPFDSPEFLKIGSALDIFHRFGKHHPSGSS